MNISAPFIDRPVATTLLTLGVALAGAIAFRMLPVSPLPQVDFPTISVQASLPGASPETMAATVATPLERSLGRIAGVTEMTSSSALGSTRVTLQFDLDRDIDGAARDVQAAINAARSLLPSGLPSNPTYRKVNPADAPIMILGLTSDTMTQGQMYDAASTIIAQKLSQVAGVGQVSVGGSSLPAVRVEINPKALNKYGIGLENVRAVLAATNANRPKGAVEDGDRHWQIYANDQAKTAAEYIPLLIAYRNGAAVRLSDVATVVDSVQDLRNAGSANGRPSVLVIINRQPNANIIETVDAVTALLPSLRASIPSAIDLSVMMERTTTIRASLRDVERTLLISVSLVVLVVFLFLRNGRATLIPSVAVPVSLIATFGAMYLVGYSLNNLSLMALTIATGFVVDDAIVVLENTTRHIEAGVAPKEAALLGAREVSFTVLSMSLSLIAVFIPILLMGGIIGRYFREFAVTLSVAIMVSLALSLTTTPMMCSRLLRPSPERRRSRLFGASERAFAKVLRGYERSLAWALDHGVLMMIVLLITVGLNIYLYVIVPKGFFPQQDTGRLIGSIQADQSISFQAMRQKLADFIDIVRADPAVDNVVGFTGGQQRNTGSMFVALKPLSQRKESRRPDRRPASGQARQGAGRQSVLQPRAGHPGRRPAGQRAIPVHASGRRPCGSPRLGAAHPAGDEPAPRVGRRQYRRAGQGPADIAGHRPRHRGAARRQPAADRCDAQRRVRPASGVDHLCAAQPVPRGDGSRSGVLAVSGSPRQHLREHFCRGAGAALGIRALRSHEHAARGQPSVAVRGLHDLVQPAAGRFAFAGHDTQSKTRSRASACRARCTAASREPRARSRPRSTASRG